MAENGTYPPPYQYAYRPIQAVPGYVMFEFSANFVAYSVLVMLAYSIPCHVTLVRLVVFFFANGGANRTTLGAIFTAFVQMQVLVALHGVADFLEVRVPSTGVLTRFCATADPQTVLKIVNLCYYTTSFSSQMLTMMFCLIRVVILYLSTRVQKMFDASLNVISLVVVMLSVAASVPFFASEGLCMQLYKPYPVGSIDVLSRFHLDNILVFNAAYFSFTSLVMCTILVSTWLMFRKLNERRKLSVRINSPYSSKAEKTLTVTVLLILIPFLFIQVISVVEMVTSMDMLSYLLFVRPFVLDCRIHLVTIYFVATHPALRAHRVVSSKTTNN